MLWKKKAAFAAVNLIMPVCMLVSCPVFFASTGGSALISQTLGEGKEALAREYFSLLVYLSALLGLVLAVPVFFLVPQLVTLGITAFCLGRNREPYGY